MNRTVLIIIVALMIWGCNSGKTTFKEIQRPYSTESPTITKLLSANDNIIKQKADHFWEKMSVNGLPFVEKDEYDPDYMYLTFIVKDTTANIEISFEVFGIYSDYRFGNMMLSKIRNTNLYFSTYKVPVDLCFSYRFIRKNKTTGIKTKSVDVYNPNRIPTGKIRKYSFSVFDLSENKNLINECRDPNISNRIDTLLHVDSILGKDRKIYVYMPPGYNPDRSKPYPVIYMFDAFIYMNRVEVPNILDNLIAEKKIEPMVAVFIASYRSTRSITLPLNYDFYNDFIVNMLPLVRNNYHLSDSPDKNIIGGMSYGGLAATAIAHSNPDIFNKVLSQSGSFWRDPEPTDSFGNEIRTDWLIKKILVDEKVNISMYIDWGLQENNVLGSNRQMIHTLKKKGYNYSFHEFNGWHDWSNSERRSP